jgi:hypothetical protein
LAEFAAAGDVFFPAKEVKKHTSTIHTRRAILPQRGALVKHFFENIFLFFQKKKGNSSFFCAAPLLFFEI